MEDDVKGRFDDLDKRLASTEHRIDDIKWFFGGLTALFTVVFGLVALLGNINFNAEKASLREFEKEQRADLRGLRAELGKIEPPPKIELLATDGGRLQGRDIAAQFETDKDGNLLMVINHFLRNSGESLSGPMYVKLYTTREIQLKDRSTDEREFSYEATIEPGQVQPNQIPGKLSMEWFHKVYLRRGQKPPAGKYPLLIKVYYGKGQVTETRCNVVIK